MKRKISFHYVRDLFKSNELFKDDYIKVMDRTVNRIRIHRSNLLKNWKLIIIEDSETKECNEALNSISTDNPLNVTDITNSSINSPISISPTSTTTTTTTTTSIN